MRASQGLQLALALAGNFNAVLAASSSVLPSDTTSVCAGEASSSTDSQSFSVTTSSAIVDRDYHGFATLHPESATVTTAAEASVAPYSAPSWWLQDSRIPSGKGNLPQNKQNGNSWLGSLKAPSYAKFVGASNQPKTYPWGSKTAQNTNPYQDAPDTGVKRSYNFVVERNTLSPDGVQRSVILVNGEFPGPTIEADWGDTIQVTVVNKISNPEEGTSLHWHGLLQTGTPFMDGIPGVTQCPIAPGQTLTYSFKADLYGTSWWHAHYSSQYAGGVFGAMIIHGPTDNAQYDVDLGPVIITDYYHDNYYDLVKQTMGTQIPQIIVRSDNNLINGKGIYNCTYAADPKNCDPNAGLSKFSFQQGKSYRLRLINAGAEGLQKFSIDNHKMNVIAYDFVPIVPYETDIVTLGVGQRADVVVTANGNKNDSVWMRSTMSSCSNTNQPNALAMIYYDTAKTDSKPTSTAWPDTTNPCTNDDLSTMKPYYSISPPSTPDLELEVDIGFGQNSTGYYVWTMNNSTFRTDYNAPILEAVQSGTSPATFPSEWNIYDIGTSKSVRITFNNLTPVVHPMHLHGHNMYVLSSTSAISSSPSLQLNNPARRDVHILPENGQIVVQMDGDNAGVWPFHCHIAWHVSGGLYINILENVNALAGIQTPGSVSGLCSAWSAFTSKEVVDQIDSGL